VETFDLGVFGDRRCDDCNGPEIATKVSYGAVGWVEIATRHEPTCPQIRRAALRAWRRRSPRAHRPKEQ
jgi:hypothetical protein